VRCGQPSWFCARLIANIPRPQGDGAEIMSDISIVYTFSQLLGMEIDDKLDSLAYLFETVGDINQTIKP